MAHSDKCFTNLPPTLHPFYQSDSESGSVEHKKSSNPNLDLDSNGSEAPSSSTNLPSTITPTDVVNMGLFEDISNGYRFDSTCFFKFNISVFYNLQSSLSEHV